MAKLVFTDSRLFVAGADLSADSNKAECSADREAKDVTNFRSGGFKEFIAGLGSTTINAEGFFEAGSLAVPDDTLQSQLGSAAPWSICPTDSIDAARAYFTSALQSNYAMFGGGLGEVADFKASATGVWPLVRGIVANSPATARTVSGTGTITQLGAVAAGQYIYANLHVLSIAGTTPSITFRVESAPTVGFAAPVTRLTFNSFTSTLGGQSLRAAGAITDQYWRAAWTVSGTTPSFLACLVFGIA